jgi:multidrug efflux pump subunit AcrB
LRRERWVTVVALLMLALVLGIAFRAWLHPDMLLEVAGLVFCN